MKTIKDRCSCLNVHERVDSSSVHAMVSDVSFHTAVVQSSPVYVFTSASIFQAVTVLPRNPRDMVERVVHNVSCAKNHDTMAHVVVKEGCKSRFGARKGVNLDKMNRV